MILKPLLSLLLFKPALCFAPGTLSIGTVSRRQYLSPSSLEASKNYAIEDNPNVLTEKQLDFTLGYLNKHHSDLLQEFAKAFSSVGTEAAKKNVWSRGSYVIENSEITSIDTKSLELKVTIQKRGESKPTIETVVVDLGM